LQAFLDEFAIVGLALCVSLENVSGPMITRLCERINRLGDNYVQFSFVTEPFTYSDAINTATMFIDFLP
jgi:hypothetical protein